MANIVMNARSRENGEPELALLIKEAGHDARQHTRKTMVAHYTKLKKTIASAVSSMKKTERK
jgi:hypothetical protein